MARHKKQEASQRNLYQKMLGTDKQAMKATEKQVQSLMQDVSYMCALVQPPLLAENHDIMGFCY